MVFDSINNSFLELHLSCNKLFQNFQTYLKYIVGTENLPHLLTSFLYYCNSSQ